MSKPSPLKVFITYSHRNRAEKDKLKKALSVMEQNKDILLWHDAEMLPGDEWNEKIAENLAPADILLYLTSSDSLDSKNCNAELTQALQKGKKVVPIILEDCDWPEHKLSNFEVLPNKGKAINEWTPESAGWQNVVTGIRKTVEAMQKAKTEPPANEQNLGNVVNLLFEQANFLVMLGQFNQAIKAYSGVIKMDPDLAETYNNRGNAYRGKGEYDRAIADFDKAITLKPGAAGAYYNRGLAYSGKGDPDRAIADYDKAIELKPDLAVAYVARGLAYKKSDYRQAIADYNKAIMLKPDLAEAYYARGDAYKEKGEYNPAIADYDKVIELKPDLAGTYGNRGLAYAGKMDYDRAIANYDKVIELKSDDPEAYYNRGTAYAAKDDPVQAIADFTLAIALKPDLAEAYYNRGEAYLHLQQWEQARKDLQTTQRKGIDIIAAFNSDFESVADFERETGITLPWDIRALLTKP